MRKSKSSKLLPVLRAMDAFTAPAQPAESQECALADCHEAASHTCVCCNRQVCIRDYDMSGTYLDEPGICSECLFTCAGGIACKVV